jgi:hypothetical protein
MRFNPFEKISASLISSFRKKGKRWLVSQTMQVTVDEPMAEEKIFLLLTHYEDQGVATAHLKAVLDDKYASLIDLEKEIHRKQLDKILMHDSKYVVYSSLIRNREKAEKLASELYKEKYMRYIKQHSQSGYSPNKSLRPFIQLIFGELYVVLKYGAETLRTRLSEIEKM